MYGEADSMKTRIGEISMHTQSKVRSYSHLLQLSLRAARGSWTGVSQTFAGRSASHSPVGRTTLNSSSIIN